MQVTLLSLCLFVPGKGPNTWGCLPFTVCSVIHSFSHTVRGDGAKLINNKYMIITPVHNLGADTQMFCTM